MTRFGVTRVPSVIIDRQRFDQPLDGPRVNLRFPKNLQRHPQSSSPNSLLHDARSIIADRSRGLRGFEAVGAVGNECDPCSDEARRFCAVGALIHAAYGLTGDHDHAHRLGWQIAGMIADAAKLRRVDEGEEGWAVAVLNDTRGQAAVLRALDALVAERRY